jgi:hypothetical protein
MSRVVVAFAILVALVSSARAAPAQAQECQEHSIDIQVDVDVFGKEGDVVSVAAVTVDPELVGTGCTGTATVTNNSSAHPENDFIIASGASAAVIDDFEREPFQVSSTTTALVLGETIDLSIRLGPDGIASIAGETVMVAVTCQPSPTTTTQPPGATTTTAPPETTTTTETPIGGVSAGGGGTASRLDAGVSLLALGAMTLLGALGLAAAVPRRSESAARRS